MDRVDLHLVPRPSTGQLEHDLAEVDAAIALVRGHVAERVRLVGLVALHRVIGVALAHAQAADVDLTLDRTGASLALTIGPRH